MSDEARAEAERRWPNDGIGGNWSRVLMGFTSRDSFAEGAAWQAERDAARIAELETELQAIRDRADEVGEDDGWGIGGAWGDYGEVVVPLRVLSYVVDGQLDQKVVEIDGGFAVTYAEQTARAEAAEAKLTTVKAELTKGRVGGRGAGETIAGQIAHAVLAIIDGTETT